MTKIPAGAYVRIGGRRQKLSPGQAKYNTVLTKKEKPTQDRFIFDSLVELKYYQELKLRKEAGDIKGFKVKPKIYCYVSTEEGIEKKGWPNIGRTIYTTLSRKSQYHNFDWLVFTYTPDFVVDGELVDVKGVETAVFRLKAWILKALGLPIQIVK